MDEGERRMSVEDAKAVRDERLGYLGCRCASCSTAAGMEFRLDNRVLRSGRKDNPVHHFLSMRAFAADRIAGGGMGWHVYQFYATVIALVFRMDKFDTSWDYDDEYVVGIREEAMRIAGEHGIGPDLGYSLDVDAIRKHLATNARRDD